jgi:hypothetical protein
MEEEIGEACSSRKDAYRILTESLRRRDNLEYIIEADERRESY